MLLFFDTETTGFMTQKPLGDASHGRIVQIAFIVTDDDGKEMASYNSLINTPVDIPETTTAIHGKTKAMCERYGVEPITALSIFKGYAKRCDKIVGHTVYFDRCMVMNEMVIAGKDWQWLEDIPYDSTRAMAQDILKFPLTEKLQEAYKHCFGVEFDGAHDALADVRACKDVYFWALNERMRNG
ncbi:MAG: 3'-5' exonuclease [Culicoidibacterales bacterium]